MSSTIILDDVKNFIGTIYDDSFDTQLCITINGYLHELNQINAGKTLDLMSAPESTWDDFFDLQVGNRSEAIKFVCYRTKLDFDPPLPATINAMTSAANEAYWRARLEFDNT